MRGVHENWMWWIRKVRSEKQMYGVLWAWPEMQRGMCKQEKRGVMSKCYLYPFWIFYYFYIIKKLKIKFLFLKLKMIKKIKAQRIKNKYFLYFLKTKIKIKK